MTPLMYSVVQNLLPRNPTQVVVSPPLSQKSNAKFITTLTTLEQVGKYFVCISIFTDEVSRESYLLSARKLRTVRMY